MKLKLVEDAEREEEESEQAALVLSLLKENERLQTELTAQRRNNELFMSVFNSLPDGLMIADKERDDHDLQSRGFKSVWLPHRRIDRPESCDSL